ncbi:hypothetical protein Agub_g15830 [Astrephomene gubernaculifera]|uniref:Transmembrane protein n=1 Tax=Astrephomene gubernaculifera TaxID=47775 RepID=A0AAD3E5I8_9CHLO|nr:hypothetical protein Agub_g15830 [Astrephomene gubernaculifera]
MYHSRYYLSAATIFALLLASTYVFLSSAQHACVQPRQGVCDDVAIRSQRLGPAATSGDPKPNTWAWLRKLQEEERAAENARKGIAVGSDSHLTSTQESNFNVASAPPGARHGTNPSESHQETLQSSLGHARTSLSKRELVGLTGVAFLCGLLIGLIAGISIGAVWARRSTLSNASPHPAGPASNKTSKGLCSEMPVPVLPDDVVAKIEAIPKAAVNDAGGNVPPVGRGDVCAKDSEGSSTWNCGTGEASTSKPCDPSPITKRTVRVAAPADKGAVFEPGEEGSGDNFIAAARVPSATPSDELRPTATAKCDAKTPWRQRPAPLDVAATPVGAASGGQTPPPAQTTCTTPSSRRRSPLASPTGVMYSVAASMLAMLAGRADKLAERTVLEDMAAELRQGQRHDTRQRRAVAPEEGTTPLPAMHLPTQDEADEPQTTHGSKPPLAPSYRGTASSAWGSVGRSGGAPSSATVPRSGVGCHGRQQQQPRAPTFSSATQGQPRLPTLPEEGQAYSQQHAMTQLGFVADPLQQQAVIPMLHDPSRMMCATDGPMCRTESGFSDALMKDFSASVAKDVSANVMERLEEKFKDLGGNLRDNTEVTRAVMAQRGMKEQRLAVRDAMTRGIWISLIVLGFGSWMWGRWEEVSRRCAADPGPWAPATSAGAGAAPGYKFLLSPSWWFSRALGLPTAQSVLGVTHGAVSGWLHWPYVSTTLCHIHEIGLWGVGCIFLFYCMVPLIRWAISISTPHSFVIDIPLIFGIVCAVPGCIAVHYLGGAWTVWLASWWVWCAVAFALHVQQTRFAWLASYMLAIVAPVVMGTLPYASWIRQVHFGMEDWAFFLMRHALRLLGKRTEAETEAFLAGNAFLS